MTREQAIECIRVCHAINCEEFCDAPRDGSGLCDRCRAELVEIFAALGVILAPGDLGSRRGPAGSDAAAVA